MFSQNQVCTGLAAKFAELPADVRLNHARKAEEDRGRLVPVVRTQVHRQSVERALVLGRLVQLGHLLHQLALLFDGEVAAHQVAMTQAKVLVELVHVDVLQAHLLEVGKASNLRALNRGRGKNVRRCSWLFAEGV